jgi:hypothetical protein
MAARSLVGQTFEIVVARLAHQPLQVRLNAHERIAKYSKQGCELDKPLDVLH